MGNAKKSKNPKKLKMSKNKTAKKPNMQKMLLMLIKPKRPMTSRKPKTP